MKILLSFFCLIIFESRALAEIIVKFDSLKIVNNDKWEIQLTIYNSDEDIVTINTGYLQHSVEYAEDNKQAAFYLLTDSQGAIFNDTSYTKVPSMKEMNLVTLKKFQYTTFTYIFTPDDDTKKMIELINSGVNIKITY